MEHHDGSALRREWKVVEYFVSVLDGSKRIGCLYQHSHYTGLSKKCDAAFFKKERKRSNPMLPGLNVNIQNGAMIK